MMKYGKENLQKEPGAMQQKGQKNQKYGKPNTALVTRPKEDKANMGIREKDEWTFKDNEEERIKPGTRAKRNPWNSTTFDADDFGGLATI